MEESEVLLPGSPYRALADTPTHETGQQEKNRPLLIASSGGMGAFRMKTKDLPGHSCVDSKWSLAAVDRGAQQGWSAWILRDLSAGDGAGTLDECPWHTEGGHRLSLWQSVSFGGGDRVTG